MKLSLQLCAILVAMLCVDADFSAQAQDADNAFPEEIGTTTSVLSPFQHLTPLSKGRAPRTAEHNICAPYVYYNETGMTVTYSQTVPTSLWATRISPLSTAATVCTVWTIYTDFEITNAPPGSKDTIQIVIKDGTPPYNQLWTTWFLARVGNNIGDIEIDPPAVPPFTRPVIYPKRDIYVGFYIRGQGAHTVTFRFKTPQQYTNPFRSVRFNGPGTFVSAASAISQNVEWVFSGNLCCDYVWPVELSAFNGVFNGRAVELSWTTESETGNAGFQIQRSQYSAGPWTTVGVLPGRGTTSAQQHYQYSDPMPFPSGEPLPSVLWYRLLQTDYDGTINELPPIQVAIAPSVADGFALHPAYPNPVALHANALVTIPYQLQQETELRLSVFDALGREVARVFDGVQKAGHHEARWFPHSVFHPLRGGTYFLRLTTARSSTVQKMTIIE